MKHDKRMMAQAPGMNAEVDRTVLARLTALKAKSVKELKADWQALFGGGAPNNSRAFLELRIGHRIQELAYGGPDRDTKAVRPKLESGDSCSRFFVIPFLWEDGSCQHHCHRRFVFGFNATSRRV